MNICIVGGGNIGTALLAEINMNTNHKVFVYTSKPHLFNPKIICEDSVTQKKFCVDNFIASSDIQSTVACSDVVLITVPSFMFKNTIDKIGNFLKPSAIVGIIPGTGGCEFYCQGMISKGHIVFGLDRVPHVARLKKYGEYIYASKKDKVRLSAMPTKETKNMCKLIEQLININCYLLNNYLTVTLIPSNLILHTARLYSMFKDYDKSIIYKITSVHLSMM